MDIRSTSYCALLAQYPDFAAVHSPAEELPEWSYASPDAPGLAELRTRYGLLSLIEGMSELDAILKLLEWAYGIVEHDGGAVNPEPRSAVNILNACAVNRAAVNCRMKAIVLSEAYLSVGFRSRYVTCLPAEYDGDCHVIVLVYASSLGKWISVDPTHNTFFTSADGAILNILEARQIYWAGSAPSFRSIDRPATGPLHCGGIDCATYDEFYEVYMCKNCFRFSCPIASEPGVDSRPDAQFVVLNPLGYTGDPGGEARIWGSRPLLVTHDASHFLAKPPTRR